ncbi:MAG: Flagellar basal body P-ring biosynthesis protein-like protein [Verrucomicrobia bacterium]|nr:Flagellar basal body P-ring biosynthesis protein-like protein [Verrucomicrobiota bacterium]
MRLSLIFPRFLLTSLVLGAFTLAGHAETESARVATTFSRDQFTNALARDLSGHFSLEGELQLELVRPWSSPARVSSNWSVAILEYPTAPSSSMLLRCRLSAESETISETTVVVKAFLWRDAWVTREPLSVGAAFDPTQLEARRVDLFRDRDVVPALVGDHSYAYARAVSAGRLLTWRDLNRRPLVRKGQIVEVSAIDGLMRITLKALAMENGAQGDTVTVRNPESRKDFSALVIDENHVQVRF